MIAAQSVSLLPAPLFRREPSQKPSLHAISHAKRSSQQIFSPNFSPVSHHRNVIVCRSNSRGPKESAFFDENGAVQDMDGYLNYLSLEYDSVWDTKPSWCQPWTITVTGVLIVTCSWLILHSILVSSIALALICGWWYVFLYAYPKQYADMIAERRKRVTDGLEDTYGARKGQ